MSPAPSPAQRSRHRIWDLPTRSFHWALLVCFVGAIVSVNIGQMQAHLVFGSSMLTLVLFRILWGFFGSQTSRFQFFLPSRKSVVTCLRAFFQKNNPHIGHDAMGALATLALLAVFLLTPLVGLFANDDLLFEGPLAALVSPSLSNYLSYIHEQLAEIAIVFVVLHITIVLFNRFYKKDDLISPMLDGNKNLPPRLALQAKSLRFAPHRRALLCLAIAAAVVASINLL